MSWWRHLAGAARRRRRGVMIAVTARVSIDERAIEERFVQATGPGGQHVNKVATAVQLRFDVAGARGLPAAVCRRLARLAGRRMTKDGVLVIVARRFRSRQRNRDDAMRRLLSLVRQAARPPRPRLATRPPPSVDARRLDAKRRRARLKRLRSGPAPDGD